MINKKSCRHLLQNFVITFQKIFRHFFKDQDMYSCSQFEAQQETESWTDNSSTALRMKAFFSQFLRTFAYVKKALGTTVLLSLTHTFTGEFIFCRQNKVVLWMKSDSAEWVTFFLLSKVVVRYENIVIQPCASFHSTCLCFIYK